MRNLIAAIILAACVCGLIASTAKAECGDRGGPGIRGANGQCLGWAQVGGGGGYSGDEEAAYALGALVALAQAGQTYAPHESRVYTPQDNSVYAPDYSNRSVNIYAPTQTYAPQPMYPQAYYPPPPVYYQPVYRYGYPMGPLWGGWRHGGWR